MAADTSITTLTTDVTATISLSVDKGDIYFGAVVLGTDSGEQAVVITNNGTVPILVTLATSGTLYNNCLWVSPGGSFVRANAFTSSKILAGSTLTIYLKVHPDDMSYVSVPSNPGSVTFIATYTP
jgi:hypothetical protein